MKISTVLNRAADRVLLDGAGIRTIGAAHDFSCCAVKRAGADLSGAAQGVAGMPSDGDSSLNGSGPAFAGPYISADQVVALENACSDAGLIVSRLCVVAKVDRLVLIKVADYQRAQAWIVVDAWNTRYTVGTPVTHYKLINPLREPVQTATRSSAWLMGGHTAMVMVDGIAGGVMVESVKPHEAA